MMQTFQFPLLPVLCAVGLGLTFLAPLPAAAKGTTQEDVLAAQILTGWQMQAGSHMTGLHLDLAPGWKTYWRAPGDAGIPPRFDWSGSVNLKAVHVHWPAPSVFHTNGYQTIGYVEDLVLPLEIVPEDPSRPVDLKLHMELGICDDICLPAFLELSSTLIPPGTPDPALRKALERGPASGKSAGLKGISCDVVPIKDGLRITATVLLPRQSGTETVAFETADPTVWVSESITTRAGGTLTAQTELVAPSGQPFALDRSGIVLTVIHDAGAVEITGCPAP
jgi:DsbC/DsbD-like thiol-disulfide interchange protein